MIISEFVAGPKTRESTFELVKMTHVCQYWRVTLISFPRLWSSVFVENDHKEFVAACLERSGRVPLDVCLDMTFRGYKYRRKYQARIYPLLNNDHTERIRKLDIRLTLAEDPEEIADEAFGRALKELKLFSSSLPFLESLSFSVHPEFESDDDTYTDLRRYLFGWNASPPTRLRHLTLHGCYGGLIPSIKNLTSFELAGVEHFAPIELDQRTFLPFVSGNKSLVSLSLAHCSFPVPELPRVTPIKLSGLKTLRLSNIRKSPGFPSLIEIPALKALSSLHIFALPRENYDYYNADFRACARSDDGFQLSIDILEPYFDEPIEDRMTSNWLGITRNADPRPTFVRFERQDPDPERGWGIKVSPLPLLIHAEVLEISVFFADVWYSKLWHDLKKIGPQLTTLRLEVIEGMGPAVAKSVKRFFRARWMKGSPLTSLERMTFDDMSEEDEAKAIKLWEEFRASLDIDQYLATQ